MATLVFRIWCKIAWILSASNYLGYIKISFNYKKKKKRNEVPKLASRFYYSAKGSAW